MSYYFRFMTMTGTASLRDEYSKGAFQSGVARYLNKYLQPEPCVGGADILAHAKAYANGEIDGGEAPAPPPARRRPLLVAAAVAVAALHGLLPLRHLLLPEASRWTGEGSLWAWHMKLSAKRGWLALHVAATDADGAAREFTLVPETDPSLYADQAGHLTHEPASTLQYARHLRALFAAKGYAVASVRASSCVAVNGRPAQPLFVADANLLAHADGDYLGVFALRSGVGTFLHPWGSAAAAACDLARPQGAADDDAAAAVQRASDAAYRWLHAPPPPRRPRRVGVGRPQPRAVGARRRRRGVRRDGARRSAELGDALLLPVGGGGAVVPGVMGRARLGTLACR